MLQCPKLLAASYMHFVHIVGLVRYRTITVAFFSESDRAASNESRPTHGRRNRGVWGSMSPHFWDQLQGTGGTGGGPMKMIFASTADSLYSVLYK